MKVLLHYVRIFIFLLIELPTSCEGLFKALNERKSPAFAKLDKVLHKLSSNTPAAVIDEREQANADCQAAKTAMAEFVAEFRSGRE
jgi:hypothetical protein